MHTYTSPRPARRLLAGGLVALVAIGCLTVAQASPASAAAVPITGGTIDWGVKQSFRSYITGPIAAGTVTVGSSVTTLAPVTRGPAFNVPIRSTSTQTVLGTDTYRFSVLPSGSSDSAARTATVESGGVVRFQGHAGQLDVVVDHIRVVLDGDDSGLLIADLTSMELASEENPTPTSTLYDDVQLADLNLTGITPTTTGDRVTYSNIPAALTAAGAEAFAGFYPAGTALDPVTITLREATAAPAPVEGTDVEGGELRWTMSRQIWGQTSLNQCMVGLDGASISGTPNDTTFADPASGITFPIASGELDEATGAADLTLTGTAVIGNRAQGNYRIMLANPHLAVAADGSGQLTADVSYSLPPGGPPPADCSLTGRVFTTPTEDVVVATFAGGDLTPGSTASLAVQYEENNFSFDPRLTAALDPSLRAHFFPSDGNPNTTGTPAVTSSHRKAAQPLRVDVTLDQRPAAPALSDFNGDGLTDTAVFRPSTGQWFAAGSSVVQLGTPSDVPVPGQWDADPQSDIAVYRPSEGRWYIDGQAFIQWGRATDVPVPGDYTGDGIYDAAVFRPSEGRWYIRGGGEPVQFGRQSDVPVPGQWDPDPATDIAMFRPLEGRWYVHGTAGFVQWGRSTDVPVPGDYNGDGLTEAAVFRPSEGRWYVHGTVDVVQWGRSTDVPVPGQWDADPATEIAIYRPAEQRWYIHGEPSSRQWGGPADIPTVARRGSAAR